MRGGRAAQGRQDRRGGTGKCDGRSGTTEDDRGFFQTPGMPDNLVRRVLHSASCLRRRSPSWLAGWFLAMAKLAVAGMSADDYDGPISRNQHWPNWPLLGFRWPITTCEKHKDKIAWGYQFQRHNLADKRGRIGGPPGERGREHAGARVARRAYPSARRRSANSYLITLPPIPPPAPPPPRSG